MLAAKCALSIRVDALGDTDDASVGTEARAKVEARLRQLEGKVLASDAVTPSSKSAKKYAKPAEAARAYRCGSAPASEGSKFFVAPNAIASEHFDAAAVGSLTL